MADPAAASASAVDEKTDVALPGLPPQPDTSRELLVRVETLAQAEMALQGRNPSQWDRLDDSMRDELRLLALRLLALRRLREGR